MPDAAIGFDHSLFDEGGFDETPETASFNTAIAAKTNEPRVRFLFDGHKYDEYVLDVAEISRTGDLSVGFARITVSNEDGTWNTIRSSLSKQAAECWIGLYFSGITGVLPLFVGYVEHIAYIGGSVIFTIRDKMARLLEKEIGSGQSPASYYGQAYNAADLAWLILTDEGGLSDLESAKNPDIDYTAWDAWESECGNNGYYLRARFTGHSIKHALSRIAYLTNSYIWVDGKGRFTFAPPAPAGSFALDETNSTIIDEDITQDNLLNQITCYYGYVPDTDSWYSDATNSYSASSVATGLPTKHKTEEGKDVWHNDFFSCEKFVDDRIAKYKWPLKLFSVTATMFALRSTLQQDATVNEPLKQAGMEECIIEEIKSINLAEGTIDLICRELI